MAFDGIMTGAVVSELDKVLKDGHISRIAEPFKDELLITVKLNGSGVTRLLISVTASLPFVYLTDENLPSPAVAPAFTMLLRKHLQGGRIISVTQPSLERIININIEHRDELGDLKTKTLIIELMGKYSNIIFTDGENGIIDSIKRVPSSMSSVREVLPGRTYFIPETTGKLNPLSGISREDFINTVFSKSGSMIKALYGTYTGFSPQFASELSYRAGIDGDMSASSVGVEQRFKLYEEFIGAVDKIKNREFCPCIITKNGEPVDFTAYEPEQYSDLEVRKKESVSEVICEYYRKKDEYTKARARSADLRRIVSNAVERTAKKLDIQKKQLESTDKMDKYRLYGELINTYGYSVKDGSDSFEAEDFYTGRTVKVPLDKELTVHENANKYFERYTKLKRTKEAAAAQLEVSRMELIHLESVQVALDMAADERDLKQISEELFKTGYIKKHSQDKKSREKSEPLHFVSTDGFDIYVGKNNIQNDELTFKTGSGSDWWFHAKKFPGSHVLLKVNGLSQDEIPDRAFNEAGALAAYYSAAKDQEKVEIDYLMRKNVKKPAGAAPGYVVYYTNYSMAVKPDISGLSPSPYKDRAHP